MVRGYSITDTPSGSYPVSRQLGYKMADVFRALAVFL